MSSVVLDVIQNKGGDSHQVIVGMWVQQFLSDCLDAVLEEDS